MCGHTHRCGRERIRFGAPVGSFTPEQGSLLTLQNLPLAIALVVPTSRACAPESSTSAGTAPRGLHCVTQEDMRVYDLYLTGSA